MTLFERKNRTEGIDRQIAEILSKMDEIGVADPLYPKLLVYLERLHDLKGKKSPNPVSRDAIINVMGSLVGIVIIVAYEQKHVMTSKAFGMIGRTKT